MLQIPTKKLNQTVKERLSRASLQERVYLAWRQRHMKRVRIKQERRHLKKRILIKARELGVHPVYPGANDNLRWLDPTPPENQDYPCPSLDLEELFDLDNEFQI